MTRLLGPAAPGGAAGGSGGSATITTVYNLLGVDAHLDLSYRVDGFTNNSDVRVWRIRWSDSADLVPGSPLSGYTWGAFGNFYNLANSPPVGPYRAPAEDSGSWWGDYALAPTSYTDALCRSGGDASPRRQTVLLVIVRAPFRVASIDQDFDGDRSYSRSYGVKRIRSLADIPGTAGSQASTLNTYLTAGWPTFLQLPTAEETVADRADLPGPARRMRVWFTVDTGV